MQLPWFIYFLEQNHNNVQLSVFFFLFSQWLKAGIYLTTGSRCLTEYAAQFRQKVFLS